MVEYRGCEFIERHCRNRPSRRAAFLTGSHHPVYRPIFHSALSFFPDKPSFEKKPTIRQFVPNPLASCPPGLVLLGYDDEKTIPDVWAYGFPKPVDRPGV